MALLKSATASIEILPCNRETPTSHWLETIVVLKIHIQDQILNIAIPKHNASLRIEDFENLINNSRKYIESLPIRPNTIEYISNSYHFIPLEPSFYLRIFAGSFSDEAKQDGTLVVEFDVGLKGLDIETLLHDNVGCTVRVQISEFLGFLDNLNEEIEAITNP